jgi:hypothetical protein
MKALAKGAAAGPAALPSEIGGGGGI